LFAGRLSLPALLQPPVQIPHDLVTVIREPAARVHLHRSLSIAWEGGGRR
jgi:hypothetical protein